MSQMEATKRFVVMQPLLEPNVEVAKNLLRCIKRILKGFDIQEKRRVSLATYILVDKTNLW